MGVNGVLETPRLLLRPVTLDDADLMLAIWNDPAFIRFVGDRGVRTLGEAKDAMTEGVLRLFDEFGYGPFCVVQKSGAERIGICGLFRREILDDPDIGFALLPPYRGSGYAPEAAHAVVVHAREDLGIKTLAAIVSPENGASIALLEKLGLSFERGITMPGEDEEISLYSMKLA